MDIDRLKAFVAVAESAHFGRAAAGLHITQPGLTKRLRTLEAEIGGALLDRDRHPIALTALGRLLLPRAQRLVAQAEAFRADAKAAVRGTIGSLHLGFGLSTLTLAPAIVHRFRSALPDVAVTMNDFSSSEQIDRIRRDELDLGFVRFPVPPDIEALPLATDRLALAAPANVRFDRSSWLEQLRATNMIALRDARGPGLAAQVRGWQRSVAFDPRVVHHADDIQTVLALVAAGLGCAIVPASSAALLAGHIRLEPLGDDTRWTVGAAWKPGRTAGPLARFIAILRDFERDA
jgi:DNA-binding transcriptional LysR family regulator